MAIKKSAEYKNKLKEIVKQSEGVEEPKEEVQQDVKQEETQEINIESDNIKDTIKQLKQIDREQNGSTIVNTAENIVSNKKLIKIVIIVVALLILSIIALSVVKKLMINYTFGKVEKGDVEQSLNYESKLETSSNQTVVSTVDATVKNVYYKKGDKVEKGKILIEFDPKYVEDEQEGYKTARANVEEMLKLYNRKKEELTIKAPCDGFVKSVGKVAGTEINVGDILGYYVPTTTFRAEYKFVYTSKTKIEEWQAVDIQYQGGIVKGVVYDIQGDRIEGQEIIVGVYVTNSQVNLSEVESTAEITTYGGTIKSNGSAIFSNNPQLPICATQSGKIATNNITEDKRVSQGDVLITIDNVNIQNKINELESNKTWLTVMIESSNTDMNKYKVLATADGIIDTEPLVVGEIVKSGQELINIKITDEIRASIQVTSQDRDLLELGKKVEVVTTNLKEEKVEGGIGEITYLEEKLSSYSDDKKYEVTIKITNEKVTKEMVDRDCTIKIPIAKSEDTLFVPKKAIVTEDGKTYIHVPTSKEEFKAVEVEVGISSDTNTEILKGKKDEIKEGQSVRIYKK